MKDRTIYTEWQIVLNGFGMLHFLTLKTLCKVDFR